MYDLDRRTNAFNALVWGPWWLYAVGAVIGLVLGIAFLVSEVWIGAPLAFVMSATSYFAARRVRAQDDPWRP